MRPGALRLFLRFAIGAILLVTAAGKLVDIPGFEEVLKTYRAFPDAVLLPLALAIPLAELALALWLFSGQFLAAAAVTAVVMHFLYAVWAAVSVLRGLRLANCGCFGVFWPRPLDWGTVAEDLVIAAASYGLLVLTDFRRYRDLFAPAVKTARILEAGERFARIHFVWAYPFPFKNRDAAVLYRSEKSEAGPFVMSWKADARPGDPKEGVRIERVNGETRVEPLDPSRCRVTYTYLGDLGGKFPGWAQEKAWKEEPVQYIRALRKRLELPGVSP